jgi:hypothetical protein
MSQRKAKRHLQQPVLLAITLGALTSPAAGLGNPCAESPDPPPECQNQTMAPVFYGFWESKTWAYYCTGDHPYYWGPSNSSNTGNWEVLQSGFTYIESIFAENGSPSKLDSLFTNWTLGQNLVVVIACSRQPPPEAAVCKISGSPISDPGCPQSDVHTYCNNRGVPVCFLTYLETCSNGAKYQCNNLEALEVWCQQCAN